MVERKCLARGKRRREGGGWWSEAEEGKGGSKREAIPKCSE